MEENKRIEEVKETKEVEFGEIRFQGDLIPYKTSKETDKIDAALVEFNKEVESIERSEINPFYKNFYCTLDQIISYVRPILAKHDLFIQQFPIYGGENMLSIKTIVKHSSGQFIESDSMPIRYGKTAQDFGGTQTYVRRYQLGAILGLSFEKDDDGNENKLATENTVQQQKTEAPTTPTRRRRV